jgi:hypothetical protein
MVIDFFHDSKEADIRIHGNGFVQAELADGSKMHIWGLKDCPKQKQSSFIHDHTTSFRSTIVMGIIRNDEYSLREVYEGTPEEATIYEKYEAIVRNKKDTILKPTGEKCFIQSRRRFYFAKGTTYEFPGIPTLFHAVFPEGCLAVTRVVRLEKEPSRNPIILVEEGKLPDNSFDRYGHPEYALDAYLRVKHMLRLK